MKSTIKLLSLSLIVTIAVSSCSIHIEKRQHRKGYFININNGKSKTKLAKSENTEGKNNKEANDRIVFSKEKENNQIKPITKVEEQKAKTTKESNFIAERKIKQPKLNLSSNQVSENKENIGSSKSLKELKKTIKNSKKEDLATDDEVWLIILVLLALIVSPLAVYFERDIGPEFWLNLILYLLGIGLIFFIPFAGLLWLIAVIHALIIIFDV